MADKRLKEYWTNELHALLKVYKQFECLLPASNKNGSTHNGEDGHYVEYLLREIFKRYLPKDLEVLTGFILRPAVKCGGNDKSRKNDEHQISTQLDIIIFDTAHYPVFQRFDNCVIVPPEGVIAILSVKKHLKSSDIQREIKALSDTSKLCMHKLDKQTVYARSPFTALITPKDHFSISCSGSSYMAKGKKAFNLLSSYYNSANSAPLSYCEMIDFIGSLSEWSLYKEQLSQNATKKEASYFLHNLSSTTDKSLGFQIILQNILSVYYANSVSYLRRPGFTDINTTKNCHMLGKIPFNSYNPNGKNTFGK